LRADEPTSVKNGTEASCLLLLQGKPISEYFVQHGPFVVNHQDDLRGVFPDYQRTDFGGWPWERPDQTHGHARGRFAKYANGLEEEKSQYIEAPV